jgi:RNA polymerase sigma-70 factor (ECF subfamily)
MNQKKVESLVERSNQNDTIAFRQLVEICQPYVFRLAFRLLCNEEEAKDVVQETLIKVWQHLHTYRNHTLFSTWLYKIACNLCFDRLREMKRSSGYVTTTINQLEFDIPDGQDVEQAIINRDLVEMIKAITHELSPKQRMVFTLRELEGLEVEEISKITGMTGAKIKSNLYLAKQYIKNKINR